MKTYLRRKLPAIGLTFVVVNMIILLYYEAFINPIPDEQKIGVWIVRMVIIGALIGIICAIIHMWRTNELDWD